MKVIKRFNLQWYEYRKRKYPVFVITCPECGYHNVYIYPIKFMICKKCDKLIPIHELTKQDMFNIVDKFGNLSYYLPVWEWKTVIRSLERKFNPIE